MLLIAGSDTTSNSTCAIIYYLAPNPHVQPNLHKEVQRFGIDCRQGEEPPLPQCIVPEGGMSVHGHSFPEGAILSVPSYTIHRDPEVWGDDVEEYRLERWFERDNVLIQKVFNPFSLGPRACVGRNLSSLELQIIVSSILRRFDFVLEDPMAEGGFLEEALEV
ncbi:cytochrome P450 [Armillaria luteobubalina]|uniref:Cytochrome P450 n=1 Tax=Armillaria luteobubalina TaxID=153913 RepID=A0AA39Q232_9AGAR|nr:cytochrome P450 [Armillaria luteobubalina]